MNVLHLNANQEGGAALCARRICKALSQQNINCMMLVANGEKKKSIEVAEPDKHPANILYKAYHRYLRMLPGYMDKIKFDKELYEVNRHFHPLLFLHHPLSEYKNISNHPLIEWADIIHLHWVSGFVDYPSFFSHIKKPIVWTLHDMNPAIGLSHFESEYSQLPVVFNSLNKRCLSIKQKSQPSTIHLVAISEFLSDVCKNSPIMSHCPITLINNGVDTNIFAPVEDMGQRMVKGMDLTDKVVFLFSSFALWDKRKGLSRIIQALEEVNCPNKVLLCLGAKSEDEPLPLSNFPILYLGLENDQTQLARLYSLADFFINASYQEGFAQTPVESMSCGTPVISTPCGGAHDLIRPFNGVVCDNFSVSSLVNGIKIALTKEYDRAKIRDYIIANYDYSIIARKYADLYKSVLPS